MSAASLSAALSDSAIAFNISPFRPSCGAEIMPNGPLRPPRGPEEKPQAPPGAGPGVGQGLG